MPRSQNFIALTVATVIGVGAFYFTLRSTAPKQQTFAGPSVVAVGRNLEKGVTINKEDLELVPPPPSIDSTLLFTKVESVTGRIANRELQKGSVIRTIDLVSQGDNLADLIPLGYQAMTIPVTLPSNLTNLIQAGNRVDILLTYERGGGDYQSITLMRNVRVIGVSTAESGGNMHITIAVTPEGSKTLSYSLKRGTLTVAIRSLAESGRGQPETFYTLEQLFKDQVLDAAKAKTSAIPLTEEIEIIRGLNRETYRFIENKPDTKQEKAK